MLHVRPPRFRVPLVSLFVALFGLLSVASAAAKPTAVVAMGDSEISGEGASSYLSGTNGPTNYCHRSLKAWIMVVSIPVDAHINLACSGADSANLTIGGPGQYGELSQADQLATIASNYRVKYVFVTVGANDDPSFGSTASRCVYAYVFQTGNGCAETDGPTWSSRVGAMKPKVDNALTSVGTVMARAGYSSSSYTLIVVSYARPVPGAPMRYADWNYWGKVWNGCPIYDSDSKWGHDFAAPLLDAGERDVAAGQTLRFLDLVDGFNGHELCARGISGSEQWVKGVTYEPSSSTWWNSHAVQQSLHPNAQGHAEIANCVGEFTAQSYREGACEIGSDGIAHAQPHP
jgi:lysophospholipase L1-like esterase